VLAFHAGHLFTQLLGLSFALNDSLGVVRRLRVAFANVLLKSGNIVKGVLAFLIKLGNAVFTFLESLRQFFSMFMFAVKLFLKLKDDRKMSVSRPRVL